ncbi:MAG: class I SAM-dependent methyltransferase [Halanaerobium sp.]|nr:class I SAM-dependent methyltransferase [Halanaerobium sp.]
MDLLQDKFSGIEGGRVLDVATGRGEFVAILKDYLDYLKIVGIDNEERILDMARENFQDEDDIEFIKMDALAMDFAEAEFDTVCLSNSLHHFEEAGLLGREMVRVLKPGGLFLLSEMCRDANDIQQETYVQIHHLGAEIDRARGQCHKETFTQGQIRKWFDSLGLELFDEFEFSYPSGDVEPERLVAAIRGACSRISELPEYEAIKKKGEEIITRLADIGFKYPTQLVMLGRKIM